MARIKIALPEKFAFTTTIPIRINDVNYGGHVGNDSILSIIHEARLLYLKSMGYSEINFGGVGMIMADVGIEFKNESFYGDTIYASVAAGEFSRAAFELYYKLETDRNEKRVPVAFAKTGMICFDYSIRKITAIPEEVLKKLKA